jgi:serine phosphatase RsbU (regulator of sigma subunit)
MEQQEMDAAGLVSDELQNFAEIMKVLKPSAGETPRLAGIDIDSVSMPLNGVLGGDHLIYLDFNRRYELDALAEKAVARGRVDLAAQLRENKHRAGILLADVAGHRLTDALVAAMLHQAFLVGSSYELEMFGQITTRLFEHIRTRFYESTNIKKLIALIYGEITDTGRFRYLSAGHTPPLVFSREFRRIMPLGAERTVSETLIGIFPAKAGAPVNEIELLGSGDILLLATDGLTEHADGRFLAEGLEPCLDAAKHLAASAICGALREAIAGYGPATDDITFVVVKRS